jgi:hypothetical protein
MRSNGVSIISILSGIVTILFSILCLGVGIIGIIYSQETIENKLLNAIVVLLCPITFFIIGLSLCVIGIYIGKKRNEINKDEQIKKNCFIHSWEGCICKVCGATRHYYPDYIKPFGKSGYSKCYCGRCKEINPNRAGHIFSKLGAKYQLCECINCFNYVHDWNGCKCKVCGDKRNDQHDWNGCICVRCGYVRETEHNWDGCICTKCKRKRETKDHAWNECICKKCGEIRDYKHQWEGCKCKNCGKVRDEDHNWNGCECIKCNKTRHDWNFVYEEEYYVDGEWVRPYKRECKICGKHD